MGRTRFPSQLRKIVLQELSMDVQAREVLRKHELLSRQSRLPSSLVMADLALEDIVLERKLCSSHVAVAFTYVAPRISVMQE